MTTYNGKKIVVEYVFPPIPIRQFDYCAYFDGEEEKQAYGYGISSDIAVAELIQLNWENGE